MKWLKLLKFFDNNLWHEKMKDFLISVFDQNFKNNISAGDAGI